MSVTFTTTEELIPTGWAVMCYGYGGAADWRGDPQPTREAAEAQHLIDHAALDPQDCDGDLIVRTYGPGGPEVNMANTNAAEVLAALGLLTDTPAPGEPVTEELVGSCDAVDFLGRILLAQAILPSDPGRPVTETQAPGGPRWIDCGRAPGYVQSRLADLTEVCDYALAHGVKVSWA